MQRKKGSNWIEMIIKMVNEFKLTVVHFARPNPMQICACAWIYRWTKRLWKIRTGPPGRCAAGPRADGPSGRWAAGPSRAVGRGPLGRGPAFSKTQEEKPKPEVDDKISDENSPAIAELRF